MKCEQDLIIIWHSTLLILLFRTESGVIASALVPLHGYIAPNDPITPAVVAPRKSMLLPANSNSAEVRFEVLVVLCITSLARSLKYY